MAREKILKEVAGPFVTPPLDGLVCSALGLVPKLEPGKFCLIPNLSFPSGTSVNDGLPQNLCTVPYTSFNAAISKLQKLRNGALMAKSLLNAQ